MERTMMMAGSSTSGVVGVVGVVLGGVFSIRYGIPFMGCGLIRLWGSFRLVSETILFQTLGTKTTSTIVSVQRNTNNNNNNSGTPVEQQQHQQQSSKHWFYKDSRPSYLQKQQQQQQQQQRKAQHDNNRDDDATYKIVVVYTVGNNNGGGGNNTTTTTRRMIKEFPQVRINNNNGNNNNNIPQQQQQQQPPSYDDYVVGQKLAIRYLSFWPEQVVLVPSGRKQQQQEGDNNILYSDPWSVVAGLLVVSYLYLILSVFFMTRIANLLGLVLSSLGIFGNNHDNNHHEQEDTTSTMVDFVWSHVLPAVGFGFGKMVLSALALSWWSS